MESEVQGTRLFVNVNGGATLAQAREGTFAKGDNKVALPQLGKDTGSIDLMEDAGKQGALTLVSSRVKDHGGAELLIRAEKAKKAKYTVTTGLNAAVEIQHRLSVTEDGKAELATYAKVTNSSQTPLQNVNISITAGDTKNQYAPRAYAAKMESAPMGGNGAEPIAASANVYRFDFGQKVSLGKKESVTLNLFCKDFVPNKLDRTLTYKGSGGQVYSADKREFDGGSVDVTLSLENSKENGLGIVLPAGSLKIVDPNGTLLSETRINDTSVGKALTLDGGKVFDIEVKRQQTHFEMEEIVDALQPQKQGYRLVPLTLGQSVSFINRSKLDRTIEFSDALPQRDSDTKKPTEILSITVNGQELGKGTYSIDDKNNRLVISKLTIKAGEEVKIEYAVKTTRRIYS